MQVTPRSYNNVYDEAGQLLFYDIDSLNIHLHVYICEQCKKLFHIINVNDFKCFEIVIDYKNSKVKLFFTLENLSTVLKIIFLNTK